MKKASFKFKIPNIQKTLIRQEMVANKNCENFIGATQVPVGIAGPIKVKSLQPLASRDYYLPLATTEGALVASINRGCKATRLSGGIRTFIENVGVTRGPLYQVKNLAEGQRLISFVSKNFKTLKKVAQERSQHLKLLEVKPYMVGKNVWLRFSFETGEAMGMNMATIACQKMSDWLYKKLEIRCLTLSGNLCVDKKPSWLNFTQGRGKKVWAEAIVKKKIVRQVLKTDPKKVVEVVRRKTHLGSAVSGSLAFNAHFANIVAALFLATGQDMAHVVEGSLGITQAEIEKNGDLYFSVFLPDLMLGTVGGGTGLPTQKEALGILGLDKAKSGDSLVLAQIVGAAVLAGELSLTAALAAGHLARAHQRLGRGE